MKTQNLHKLAAVSIVTLFLGVIQSCSPDQSGSGGQEASYLGVGRKGFPAKDIAPGETVVLCDITGIGTIRHIWMTGGFKDKTVALRSMVVRAFWENQEHPSVECPLGDFMGSAHAKANSYQSAVHSTGINAAFNIWIPMPFNEHAKMTLTNEGDETVTLFYQIDYTIGDSHPEKLGRLLAPARSNLLAKGVSHHHSTDRMEQ